VRRAVKATGGEKVREGSVEERVRVTDWSCTVAMDARIAVPEEELRNRKCCVELCCNPNIISTFFVFYFVLFWKDIGTSIVWMRLH